jgi:glycyl-tRNA synthetase beta chain
MNRAPRRSAKQGGELVLEIGTEEIPSRVLPQAILDLKENLARMLTEARIPAERIETFATPRRLVALAVGLPLRQTPRVTEVTGPPRSAAYDSEGRPTAAATGFARSQGISVERLRIRNTEKGEYLCVVRKEAGQPSIRILSQHLPAVISSLIFPKMMIWDSAGMRFARPIRWLLAVIDGQRVPFGIGVLKSGNLSRGHRFISNGTFTVRNWDGYRRELKRRHVILDPSEREQVIRGGLARLARQKKGRVSEDLSLISQAVFLTEDPNVMMGGFEKKYLELPPDVPVTVMKEHQGYFPLLRGDGKLLPHFIFVSDGATKNADLIRAGNERVIRARLEDARFYFEQDLKRPLDQGAEQLKGLVFHQKLGNLYQKSIRVKDLAIALMRESGQEKESIDRLEKAALLCKMDLLTGMVREFPSLQGVIGREYARLENADPEVAEAIEEHYFPRHADDQNPPRTLTGKFLTAADRLDSITGFFGAELIPSGSMDPYALRRQGLGLIQVLLDGEFEKFSLIRAVEVAAQLYHDAGISLKRDPGGILESLRPFMAQRMETYLRRWVEWKKEPYRADLTEAILCRPFDNPLDLYLRFVALTAIHDQPDFNPLIVVFKRASRILPAGFEGSVQAEALQEPVERALYQSYKVAESEVSRLMAAREYIQALQALSQLRAPIDAFFNGVMVMDQNRLIRENRLGLLQRITRLFEAFGDFTRVAVEEGPAVR